jgi:BirA family biotin operon repressor/biotin-[acetyl-CoA-carboxylase] ligase
VLIETLPMRSDACEEGTRWVVIGIGMNVRAVPDSSSDNTPVAAACVADWWPQATAPACWHQVVPAVLESVQRFEREGASGLIAHIEQRELLVGQPVTLSSGLVREGLCLGLDADGALRVQSGGHVHRIVAGEVSVRPAAPT